MIERNWDKDRNWKMSDFTAQEIREDEERQRKEEVYAEVMQRRQEIFDAEELEGIEP